MARNPPQLAAAITALIAALVLTGWTLRAPGLGLAISKRLIEAMRGTIGFESVRNVGSTFWIELPLAENQRAYKNCPHPRRFIRFLFAAGSYK